jgi:hypothetical protein
VAGGFKHILKKYFKYYKVRGRFDSSIRKEQITLMQRYQTFAGTQIPKIEDTGFKLFSQYEEDGKLLFLFSLLRMSNKTFVEFGSDDGINSNTANLYFHHDWNGLYIDGNERAISRGRYFFKNHRNMSGRPPRFVHAKITAENINDLISSAGIKGEIGLLSIDIDGNDYWVWKAIDVVSPQVVIIETHNEFGMNDIVVPYDPDYFFPGKHPDYHGASPVAMTKLANHKGYRLVGSNELGFNFIYLRNDLLIDEVPEVSVESLLQHPSNKEVQARFEAIKDWEYVTEELAKAPISSDS